MPNTKNPHLKTNIPSSATASEKNISTQAVAKTGNKSSKNNQKKQNEEKQNLSLQKTVVSFPLLTRTFAHAKRVELFADQLFHSLQSLHKLKLDDNKLLCTAAYLHDIGWIYGRQSHNKVAGKIIRKFAKENKFIPKEKNFDPALQEKLQEILEKSLKKHSKKEILLISLIARYHRKADPKQRHKYYCDLSEKDKYRANILSGILKIADALDYTHTSAVKTIDTELAKTEIILNLHCDSQYIAEKERVNEKKQLLQETLKKVLTCQIKSKKEKN